MNSANARSSRSTEPGIPKSKAQQDLETISKRLLSAREDVPADERAAKFQECFVNVSAALEAYAKTTEIVETCMSAFEHPAKLAETATVFGSAFREHWLDAALA